MRVRKSGQLRFVITRKVSVTSRDRREKQRRVISIISHRKLFFLAFLAPMFLKVIAPEKRKTLPLPVIETCPGFNYVLAEKFRCETRSNVPSCNTSQGHFYADHTTGTKGTRDFSYMHLDQSTCIDTFVSTYLHAREVKAGGILSSFFQLKRLHSNSQQCTNIFE